RPMEAGDAPEPRVGDHDVLVDINAAGVNLLDAKVRDGEFKLFLPYKAPFVLGHDLAGVVSRRGSAVTRFTAGAEVYARPRDGRIGTFAERIAVHDYDVVLDSQGGDTLAKSLTVLKPGGIAIGIAGPPDPDFARKQGLRLPLRLAMALLSFKTRRAARRQGVRYSFLFMHASRAQLGEITKLIESGVLRPIVDRTYPFDQAAQALAHVE